jgi:hypothetical protein
VNDATAAQLALLREIDEAFAAAGTDWWLFGGWAMDAHAGRVTRDHADIELFVRVEDAAVARTTLTGRGFVAPPPVHPGEGQPFLRDGQEVGVWFVTDDADGSPVTPGRWSDWPWPVGSFDGPRVRLGDLLLPVMSVAGLLEMKRGFAKHPHGAPLRQKDEADIVLLLRLASGEFR